MTALPQVGRRQVLVGLSLLPLAASGCVSDKPRPNPVPPNDQPGPQDDGIYRYDFGGELPGG